MHKGLATATVAILLILSACGKESELSRSEAKQAIEERWNSKGDFPTVTVQVGEYSFIPESEEYRLDSVCFSLMESGLISIMGPLYDQARGEWRNWAAAAEAGFITTQAQAILRPDLGPQYTAIKCTIQLTDKAAEFVKEKDDRGHVTLKAVERVDVEVTGLSKPGEGSEQTVSEAVFTYKYKLNPLGEALAEPIRSLSEPEPKEDLPDEHRALFRLYDDGWRLEESRLF